MRQLNNIPDLFDGEPANFILNDIKNGEYLMIKGSNSTGLQQIVSNIKKGRIYAL